MRNKLISDINNYISYLNGKGYFVSVHGKTICGLLENNSHTNPFCSFIKTNTDAWDRCIKCQQKVFKYADKEEFYGMCFAGVEEYVFFSDPKTFVSVSGYGIDEKNAMVRISSVSKEYKIDKKALTDVYKRGLIHSAPNTEELKTLINPLCHMLSLLQLTLGENLETETRSKTFDSVLSYVQRNYTEDISLRDIAHACACSESTVSHLFKTYKNISVKKYITSVRIKKAESFLKKSDLSVTDIALLCGFFNTNYFSTAFKKETGMSPSEYRKSKA